MARLDFARIVLLGFAAAALVCESTAGPAEPSATRTPGAASASPAGAACDTPAACFARMAAAQRAVGSLHARFRQVKTIALLREPLVSTGKLTYERPDRVRWEVETPDPLVVEMSSTGLRAGPPGEVQAIDAGAAVRLFGDLAGLFTASQEYASTRFSIGAGPAGWGSFLLTPRDPTVSQVIESIELDTDPALGLPRRAVLREPGGDRTEIELLDIETTPAKEPSEPTPGGTAK
jgi:outer membrane lipoprotein carrier protein